jgi:hypothetical protein
LHKSVAVVPIEQPAVWHRQPVTTRFEAEPAIVKNALPCGGGQLIAQALVDRQDVFFARFKAAIKMYVASGKSISPDLLREGQRGIVITGELRQFMESIMPGFANIRIHDLKHTFGRRLRAAGVPLETRKVLLGHKNGDITSHYSAPEIDELLEAANRVCRGKSGKSPAMTLLKRKIA